MRRSADRPWWEKESESRSRLSELEGSATTDPSFYFFVLIKLSFLKKGLSKRRAKPAVPTDSIRTDKTEYHPGDLMNNTTTYKIVSEDGADWRYVPAKETRQ